MNMIALEARLAARGHLSHGALAMANPTDAIVAALEHDWPNWQIWVVHRVYGGPVSRSYRGGVKAPMPGESVIRKEPSKGN